MKRDRFTYDIPDHRVVYDVELKTADLKVDPIVQRNLTEARARRIADELYLTALGLVCVARRVRVVNGRRQVSYYIVDGQHRVFALRLLGIETVRCEVHYDLTRKQEGDLFLLRNREARTVAPLEQYRIGLASGQPICVETEKVLQAHGLEMASCRKSSTNRVSSVEVVLGITGEWGAITLDRALSIVEAAWGRGPSTWNGILLHGVARFIARYPEDVDDAELVRRLARMGTVDSWRGQVAVRAKLAGNGGGARTAMYALVRDAWNKGRRAAARLDVAA